MIPRVSVWLPSYQHAPYLATAIDSVLAQTLPDVELVVVEDGSTDGSLAIAQRYAEAHPGRVRVVTHPGHENRGVEASAALGVRHARGRYLLGMSSDDVLRPEALEVLAPILDRRPSVGMVYAYVRVIDEAGGGVLDGRRMGIDVTAGGRPLEQLVQGNTIPGITALLRRECVEAVGDLDPALEYSDWEFFVRLAAHWEIAFVAQPLAGFRVHGRNTSMQPPAVTRERSLAVTRSLRDQALEIGGGLAEPRIRALLELQLGYLRFLSGEEQEAPNAVRAALALDPSLRRDGRWLGEWLWSRLFDRVHETPPSRFAACIVGAASPLLAPAASRALRRRAAAADAAARAIEATSGGRRTEAAGRLLAAGARAPELTWDRRLASVLLDADPAGEASAVRAVRRRLRRR